MATGGGPMGCEAKLLEGRVSWDVPGGGSLGSGFFGRWVRGWYGHGEGGGASGRSGFLAASAMGKWAWGCARALGK